MADWFTNMFSGRFSQDEQQIIHLTARVSELEAVNSLLIKQNDQLLERVREFELDNRNTQRGLLTRLGVLAAPATDGERKPELKPVRKATVPWNVAAAKLEADSRERYWKKVIEDREKPQEVRRTESEAKTGVIGSDEQQIQDDIREMEK